MTIAHAMRKDDYFHQSFRDEDSLSVKQTIMLVEWVFFYH